MMRVSKTQRCGFESCMACQNFNMTLSPRMKAHLDRLHETNKKPEAAQNRVRHAYVFGAKKRGLVFELSDEVFARLISGLCHYCGEPPSNTMNDGGYGFRYNGIDRLDSEVGYVADNCVSCCGICNDMKKNLSKEEFLDRIKKIALYQCVV